ncbi:hypothetical protein [Peribacillus sp. SCS-155]|uniref:hypothetical protein n=1 Tax=Peribacillus sedimenti TaxID=3115297 RepID=UPI00390674AF
MVGIVFLLNTTYAPYMQKYIDVLESENEDFEVIYWNRLGAPDCPEKYKSIVYNKTSKLSSSYGKKIKDLLGFRNFVLQTISKRKYDKLIILTTLTGIFMCDFLVKNYKNKYIFDIRDYTFEKLYPFKLIENMVIKNSFFTTISSDKFKTFLPSSNKYVVSHNIIREEIEEAKSFKRSKGIEEPINITFIGAVRHFEIDKKIALKLANDVRFNITYHGYGVTSDKFKQFCEDNSLNVKITGKYNRKEKMNLLANADIINAYYGTGSYANLYAMPNKYYDSLIYKIPFWANPKVHSGERASKAGIGINVDLDSNSLADDLYHEYLRMDIGKFRLDCDNELAKIIDEDNHFIQRVMEFIK